VPTDGSSYRLLNDDFGTSPMMVAPRWKGSPAYLRYRRPIWANSNGQTACFRCPSFLFLPPNMTIGSTDLTARCPKAVVKKFMPVALPPGRARLATRPNFTGSPPTAKTIGIVWVAALAASAEAKPPVAAIRDALTPNQFAGERQTAGAACLQLMRQPAFVFKKLMRRLCATTSVVGNNRAFVVLYDDL
jgi:hypothetical protein